MSEPPVTILGAGMAGFGAANRLTEQGVRPVLYEARPTIGGHTSTHFYDDGFAFDEGPHISFTSNERIQALLAQSVNGRFERLKAYVNNYWRGHWIKHPAQVNLHGLPHDLVVRCIADFVAASRNETPVINHYEDWLRASFGDAFAAMFPMQYTKKYHTTEAANLTTDWLGPRLYRPTLEEMLLGALKPEPLDVHYVDDFRYPSEGGFVAYLEAFKPMADISCGRRVVAIDPAERRIAFEDGGSAAYAGLISSIPLPRLLGMIKGAPEEVRRAAGRLACSQLVLVNIGVRGEVKGKAQWTYFYDAEFPFARLSYPSRFSPSMAPPGHGSIQAEIYFSEKWKPLPNRPDDWIEPTIDGLIRCGLVRERADVVHASTIFAPFANVIFDHDRPAALKLVHGYLDHVGIAYCGRYGDWGYIWTDQAFMSGERAAVVTLDRLAAHV